MSTMKRTTEGERREAENTIPPEQLVTRAGDSFRPAEAGRAGAGRCAVHFAVAAAGAGFARLCRGRSALDTDHWRESADWLMLPSRRVVADLLGGVSATTGSMSGSAAGGPW
jgi:hypothetical protein